MPNWMDEAKNLTGEHPDIADEGFDKAEDYLGVQDQDDNQHP